MAFVYIGLGTNLGNKKENLTVALQLLAERVGEITTLSSFVETEPWGFESKNTFLNAVVAIRTNLLPDALLQVTQQIERDLGRTIKGGVVYQDRLIDIDLLAFDQKILRSSVLTLPHPLIAQREFVLQPFAEIAPDYIHPLLKKSMKQLYTDFKSQKKDDMD